MLKHFFGILAMIIGAAACKTPVKDTVETSVNDSTWSLPKADSALPASSYATLTQVYDQYSLDNRDITYRDERLLTMRGINTYFANAPVYKSAEDWEKRKAYLKEHILVSTGLWPMPDKTPLKPVSYRTVDHPDYTVETVTIETYPGFLLGGNVYRPKGKGPFPAILNAHGHFPYGRLNNDTINSIPGRCINLARQGFVVFAYDMVGYNDTRQVAHNTFADDSVSAMYGISLMGLQLWNSIRAMDYLRSLPNIDTSRVGITGASGGGTQVFLFTAVDDRFDAAAPVNMISNTMQGGDICENAPGLRRNTFNVEIAAMVAPKPLLLVSDTYDWTFNTRNTIMPMMRSFFHLYDAEDKLKNAHFDYIHNYNKASRGAMYEFFGKWLMNNNNLASVREKPFEADQDQDLLAFMNKRDTNRTASYKELPAAKFHNAPALDEQGFKEQLKSMYAKQLNDYWPTDTKLRERFDSIYGTAMNHTLDVREPAAIDCKIIKSTKGSNFIVHQLLIARKDSNDWIPCTLYQPLTTATATVILTADSGKSKFVDEGLATPNRYVTGLLEKNYMVLTPDLFMQGEHNLQKGTKTPRDESVKHFTAYNLTQRQEQIQDLLTIIKAIQASKDIPHEISLFAMGNTGLTGLLASTVTKNLSKLLLDGNHFDPGTDQRMLTLDVPGIMRIGGLPTALALASKSNVLLYNAHPGMITPKMTALTTMQKNTGHFSMLAEDISADRAINFLVNK